MTIPHTAFREQAEVRVGPSICLDAGPATGRRPDSILRPCVAA